MSRYALPWIKLKTTARRDAAILLMPLEQQAVFYNLLQHASERDPRGTFCIAKPYILAADVARCDEAALLGAVEHLVRFEVVEYVDDTTLRFTHWDEYQSKAASAEPEAIADRVAQHREKHRSETPGPVAMVTPSAPQPPTAPVPTPVDDATAHPVYGLADDDDTEADRIYRAVAATLEIAGQPYVERALLDTLRDHADEPDPIGQSVQAMSKMSAQKRSSAGGRQSFYRQWLVNLREDRAAAPPPTAQMADLAPVRASGIAAWDAAYPEMMAVLTEGQRSLYIDILTPSMEGRTLVLTAPTEYQGRMAEKQAGRVIRESVRVPVRFAWAAEREGVA